MRPVRGHEVDGFDGAQRDHMLIAPRVTLNADGFYRQEDRKRLADLVVEVMAIELLDEDGVGAA